MTRAVQPFVVSVAEILGHPGEYRELDLEEGLTDVGTALATLAETPIRARLRLESVVEGILVTGRVWGRTKLQCARCLTDFSGEMSLRVCELFVTPAHREVEEDAYEVGGSEIDLAPMLRDATTLALPLNPICDVGCRGLCAGCGKDLREGPCDCTDDGVDPRWAPLETLRDKLEG